MRYLLDTNAVIALLNDPRGAVAQRARQHSPQDVGLPVIVIHELFYGAFKSLHVERNLARIDALPLEVLPYDPEDAREAGAIRATLAHQGTPIGGFDVLIAGQARARGLVLVTRNLGEFSRVDNLTLENWEGD